MARLTVFLFVVCLGVVPAGTAQAEPTLTLSAGLVLDRMQADGVFSDAVAEPDGIKRTVESKRPERFFGRRNLILGGILIGANISDIETTFAALKNPQVREGNPVARIFVNHGRKATYPAGIGMNLLTLAAGLELRKSDHKGMRVLGWALPIVAAGAHTFCAVHNYKIYQKYF